MISSLHTDHHTLVVIAIAPQMATGTKTLKITNMSVQFAFADSEISSRSPHDVAVTSIHFKSYSLVLINALWFENGYWIFGDNFVTQFSSSGKNLFFVLAKPLRGKKWLRAVTLSAIITILCNHHHTLLIKTIADHLLYHYIIPLAFISLAIHLVTQCHFSS